ncbi:MAG: hypothetical protein HFI40_06970 [Lachnospiraceae bacterium]|nr:hypothetical protein [Lachnospiraceae bacterium]
MRAKICLVIIFNHRYDQNIDILEKIYKGRFEAIYYLVPFYDGKKENVIPVYESSFQFQGYVAQGWKEFYRETYSHYLFIGDDLILNPSINQENFFEYFKMKPESSYCPSCVPLGRYKGWGYEGRMYNAYFSFSQYTGTNYQEEILSSKKAFQKVYEYGYSEEDFYLTKNQLFHCNLSKMEILYFILKHPGHTIKLLKRIPLSYPVFGGYSDIFLLHKQDIKVVSKMFGVFAAIRLFVEMAIPTAMRLQCKELQIGGSKSKVIWELKEKEKLEQEYLLNLNLLFRDWPKEINYIHPVKLSKWRIE